MSLLTLIRHGQASFLEDDYDRLSPLGERQARHLGEYWVENAAPFDLIFEGPRRRQIRTAECAGEAFRAAGKHWPEPRRLAQFDEYAGIELMVKLFPSLLDHYEDLRDLDRRYRAAGDREEAARLFEKAFQRVARLWVNGEIESKDIESWREFRARVADAISEIRSCAASGSRVAVFTSGGVIAAAAGIALDLSHEKTLELSWVSRNASYSEFLFSGERFSLSCFNAHPHLDTELLTYR